MSEKPTTEETTATEERAAEERPAPGNAGGEERAESARSDGASTDEAAKADSAAAEADSAAAEAAEAEGEGQAEAEPESEFARAQRERAEYLEMAQRARAELDNYRKRVAGEARSAEERGKATVARTLIPALDNLERALLAAGIDPHRGAPNGESAGEEAGAHTALAEGVALVYRELAAGLERCGVGAFDPTGERFDPASHEAIATRTEDGIERGVVIETLEKGYRIGEQVLRPARVVVGG